MAETSRRSHDAKSSDMVEGLFKDKSMTAMMKCDRARAADCSSGLTECRARLSGIALSVEFVHDCAAVEYKDLDNESFDFCGPASLDPLLAVLRENGLDINSSTFMTLAVVRSGRGYAATAEYDRPHRYALQTSGIP